MSYRIAVAVLLAASFVSVQTTWATTLAARVAITGIDNASTAATVTVQTAGPTLFVATDPPNLGDISLLTGASTVVGGGVPLAQANGVVIAAPNKFKYTAVGDRNMVETPGELSATVPGGFPQGMWLSTTNVSGAGNEFNFEVALANFPFADGWIAGHVRGTDGTFLAGNPGGLATVTTQFGMPVAAFGNGHYKVSITNVDSRSGGMLFAQGEANSSSGNVVPVGILPDGSGWDVRINDQGLNFPNTEQSNWSFVFVPYDAQNLVAGGNVGIDDATTITTRLGVGTFSVSRVDLGVNGSITPPTVGDGTADAGRFLITIPGHTDMTGYLMVGVSKFATAGDDSGADDNMLTWEYNSTLGGFLVESYDLAGANLQNSDIYFAFFTYANPIAVPEPQTLCLTIFGIVAIACVRGRRAA